LSGEAIGYKSFLYAILEDAALVGYRKSGLWVNYQLADGGSSPYAATLLGNLKHWLQNDPEVVRMAERPPTLRREDICKKRPFFRSLIDTTRRVIKSRGRLHMADKDMVRNHRGAIPLGGNRCSRREKQKLKISAQYDKLFFTWPFPMHSPTHRKSLLRGHIEENPGLGWQPNGITCSGLNDERDAGVLIHRILRSKSHKVLAFTEDEAAIDFAQSTSRCCQI
jgi:hypothetical protein